MNDDVSREYLARFDLFVRAIHWLLVTRLDHVDALSIADLPREFHRHFEVPLQWEKLLGERYTTDDVTFFLSSFKSLFVVADQAIYPVPITSPKDFYPTVANRGVFMRVLYRRSRGIYQSSTKPTKSDLSKETCRSPTVAENQAAPSAREDDVYDPFAAIPNKNAPAEAVCLGDRAPAAQVSKTMPKAAVRKKATLAINTPNASSAPPVPQHAVVTPAVSSRSDGSQATRAQIGQTGSRDDEPSSTTEAPDDVDDAAGPQDVEGGRTTEDTPNDAPQRSSVVGEKKAIREASANGTKNENEEKTEECGHEWDHGGQGWHGDNTWHGAAGTPWWSGDKEVLEGKGHLSDRWSGGKNSAFVCKTTGYQQKGRKSDKDGKPGATGWIFDEYWGWYWFEAPINETDNATKLQEEGHQQQERVIESQTTFKPSSDRRTDASHADSSPPGTGGRPPHLASSRHSESHDSRAEGQQGGLLNKRYERPSVSWAGLKPIPGKARAKQGQIAVKRDVSTKDDAQKDDCDVPPWKKLRASQDMRADDGAKPPPWKKIRSEDAPTHSDADAAAPPEPIPSMSAPVHARRSEGAPKSTCAATSSSHAVVSHRRVRYSTSKMSTASMSSRAPTVVSARHVSPLSVGDMAQVKVLDGACKGQFLDCRILKTMPATKKFVIVTLPTSGFPASMNIHFNKQCTVDAIHVQRPPDEPSTHTALKFAGDDNGSRGTKGADSAMRKDWNARRSPENEAGPSAWNRDWPSSSPCSSPQTRGAHERQLEHHSAAHDGHSDISAEGEDEWWKQQAAVADEQHLVDDSFQHVPHAAQLSDQQRDRSAERGDASSSTWGKHESRIERQWESSSPSTCGDTEALKGAYCEGGWDTEARSPSDASSRGGGGSADDTYREAGYGYKEDTTWCTTTPPGADGLYRGGRYELDSTHGLYEEGHNRVRSLSAVSAHDTSTGADGMYQDAEYDADTTHDSHEHGQKCALSSFAARLRSSLEDADGAYRDTNYEGDAACDSYEKGQNNVRISSAVGARENLNGADSMYGDVKCEADATRGSYEQGQKCPQLSFATRVRSCLKGAYGTVRTTKYNEDAKSGSHEQGQNRAPASYAANAQDISAATHDVYQDMENEADATRDSYERAPSHARSSPAASAHSGPSDADSIYRDTEYDADASWGNPTRADGSTQFRGHEADATSGAAYHAKGEREILLSVAAGTSSNSEGVAPRTHRADGCDADAAHGNLGGVAEDTHRCSHATDTSGGAYSPQRESVSKPASSSRQNSPTGDSEEHGWNGCAEPTKRAPRTPRHQTRPRGTRRQPQGDSWDNTNVCHMPVERSADDAQDGTLISDELLMGRRPCVAPQSPRIAVREEPLESKNWGQRLMEEAAMGVLADAASQRAPDQHMAQENTFENVLVDAHRVPAHEGAEADIEEQLQHLEEKRLQLEEQARKLEEQERKQRLWEEERERQQREEERKQWLQLEEQRAQQQSQVNEHADVTAQKDKQPTPEFSSGDVVEVLHNAQWFEARVIQMRNELYDVFVKKTPASAECDIGGRLMNQVRADRIRHFFRIKDLVYVRIIDGEFKGRLLNAEVLDVTPEGYTIKVLKTPNFPPPMEQNFGKTLMQVERSYLVPQRASANAKPPSDGTPRIIQQPAASESADEVAAERPSEPTVPAVAPVVDRTPFPAPITYTPEQVSMFYTYQVAEATAGMSCATFPTNPAVSAVSGPIPVTAPAVSSSAEPHRGVEYNPRNPFMMYAPPPPPPESSAPPPPPARDENIQVIPPPPADIDRPPPPPPIMGDNRPPPPPPNEALPQLAKTSRRAEGL